MTFPSMERTFLEKGSNAFSLGPGVRYLYDGIHGMSVETPDPMHLFLEWPGEGPAFNPTRFKKESYCGYKLYINNPPANVQLAGI